jgi:hypothetical protein
MQGLIRCALVAGIFCACHADDTTTPDGSEGGGEGGLIVQWSSRPDTWPAQIANGLTVESARFACDSLRVIGDAGPGDMRTAAGDFEVLWEGATVPTPIMFADAPSGLYSQLSLLFDGQVVDKTVDIEGTVVVSNNLEEFVIEDSNPLPITLAIEKSVSPGATATIRIDIDFAHALEAVHWDQLPKSDGKLELESGNPDMAEFRKKLGEAFSTPNINVTGSGLH